MKKIVTMALIVIIVFGLSACSSKKTSKPKDLRSLSEQKNSDGLKASARLLAEGIIKADGNQVFDQIATSCQLKLSKTSIVKQLRTVRAYLTTFIGASLDDFSIKTIDTRNVKKANGQARYTILIEGKSRELLAKALGSTTTTSLPSGQSSTTASSSFAFDRPSDWFDFVYENNSWKLQSCDEFIKSSGLFSQQTTN